MDFAADCGKNISNRSGALSLDSRVNRRFHALSRLQAKAFKQRNGEVIEMMAESYLGGSVPVENLFLELYFNNGGTQLVPPKGGVGGARKQDLERTHDSAETECQLPRIGEARRSTSNDRRPVADTVSCRANAKVVGGFASGKWFVNLTGEVPTGPLGSKDSQR